MKACFNVSASNMSAALAPSMSAQSKNGVFSPACFIHTEFKVTEPLLAGLSYLTAFVKWHQGGIVKLRDSCSILCHPCPH